MLIERHCRFARSGMHLEDHVEWRFGRPPETLEARFGRDLAQFAFAGLGTKAQRHFLRERRRCADEGRGVIEDLPDDPTSFPTNSVNFSGFGSRIGSSLGFLLLCSSLHSQALTALALEFYFHPPTMISGRKLIARDSSGFGLGPEARLSEAVLAEGVCACSNKSPNVI
jgi:hypothetical protein